MRDKRSWAILGIGGILFVGGIAQAGLLNGSFESGSFYGWQVQATTGQLGRSAQTPGAGMPQIVAQTDFTLDSAVNLTPKSGQRFALLSSLPGNNRSAGNKYELSLSQTIALTAGATLSGWAAFFNGNRTAQDRAWVKIYDSAGNLLATPWQASSGRLTDSEFCLTPFRSVSDWTVWNWLAPDNDAYTVRLGLTTEGSTDNSSYGFFDHLFVSTPAAVPEPSSLSLLIVAGGLMGLWRRRQFNHA